MGADRTEVKQLISEEMRDHAKFMYSKAIPIKYSPKRSLEDHLIGCTIEGVEPIRSSDYRGNIAYMIFYRNQYGDLFCLYLSNETTRGRSYPRVIQAKFLPLMEYDPPGKE